MLIRFIFISFFYIFNLSFAATYNLESIKLVDLVRVVYKGEKISNYVLDDNLLKDERIITLQVTSVQSNNSLNNILENYGYIVNVKNGITYIKKKEDDCKLYTYLPKYRTVDYLLDYFNLLNLKSSIVDNSQSKNVKYSDLGSNKVDKNKNNGLNTSTSGNKNYIVYCSTYSDIEKISSLLKIVDTQPDEGFFDVSVIEVSQNDKKASSIEFFYKLLSSKISINLFTYNPLSSSVKINSDSINTIYSVINTNDNIKILTSPKLRILNGEIGKITVGQDVPVLSSVTSSSGQVTQSVDYKSSGIILNLLPTIFDENVKLDINQQVSQYVTTNTGVSATPTLNKREISTSLTMRDGETVFIAGMEQDKNISNTAKVPFLPDFLSSTNNEVNKSGLVFMITYKKVKYD